ncbi:protein phosphatase 1 regulatory subunit 7 [Enteropsectra breve]|nr:protein phosphatase 1 regulatory subunit 7 [Enteropsectra breve]
MDDYPEEKIFVQVKQKLTEFPEIPDEIVAVDVHRNSIKKLNLNKESKIEYLDLSDNILNTIEGMGRCPMLKVLDCSYNVISSISPVRLEFLEELYLSANDISLLKNIAFNRLKKLDLAGNNIARIENMDAPELEEIYLSSNKIKSIENLDQFTHLKILDLQYNRLSEIDCKCIPPTLEILMLQGNTALTKILNIECLPTLKILNIKNTRIKIQKIPNVDIWI